MRYMTLLTLVVGFCVQTFDAAAAGSSGADFGSVPQTIDDLYAGFEQPPTKYRIQFLLRILKTECRLFCRSCGRFVWRGDSHVRIPLCVSAAR